MTTYEQAEQRMVEIHNDVMEIRQDMKLISLNGCAKREGDLFRMQNVEDSIKGLGSKMDKIFYASLATAVGIIVFLIKMFVSFVIK